MAEFFLKTEDLTVGYQGVPLIRDIRIQVSRGEILTLIGPNGAGKSTILKSIIRQLAPIAGTVYLDRRSMAQLSEKQIAQTMSVLMTDRVRPELMTCEDVVATGRYPYTGRLGILSAKDREAVANALELVHAANLKDRSFDQISDGQRQRILLARAICQEPEIIILDEPTSFLDIRHKLELLTILKQMVRQRNVAVIMSVHELDLAQRISDWVVCVNGSVIDRYGRPEEVFQDEYIHQLYGITSGSYNALYGCAELEAPAGPPQVFVIGGGGSGIPVYRLLQRRGIPFAAGILQENDLDWPVARALAGQCFTAPAFCAPSEDCCREALAALNACQRAVCCLTQFGEHHWNQALCRAAEPKRCSMEELQRL